MHWRNKDERAIRTFDNHFIAGLYSVNRNLPLQIWHRLLDQATHSESHAQIQNQSKYIPSWRFF